MYTIKIYNFTNPITRVKERGVVEIDHIPERGERVFVKLARIECNANHKVDYMVDTILDGKGQIVS